MGQTCSCADEKDLQTEIVVRVPDGVINQSHNRSFFLQTTNDYEREINAQQPGPSPMKATRSGLRFEDNEHLAEMERKALSQECEFVVQFTWAT